MYPRSQLQRLNARKQRVLLHSNRHRAECVEAGERVASTLRKADEWRQRLQTWGGMASVFMPFFFRRKEKAEGAGKRKRGRFGRLIEWASLGLKVARKFRSF